MNYTVWLYTIPEISYFSFTFFSHIKPKLVLKQLTIDICYICIKIKFPLKVPNFYEVWKVFEILAYFLHIKQL